MVPCLTVIAQLTSGSETFMLWAKMGKVGPVILNNYFKSGSGRAEFTIRLFKYLTNAPIVILAMQKAIMNHVGEDFFEIIPILNFFYLSRISNFLN